MTNNKIKLNDNDKKVIYALLENARQTAVELSNKTGLSRQTVNKTIQKLEENNIIWGHYPVINMKTLGKKIFIMLLRSKPGITIEKTLEYILETKKLLKEQKTLIPMYTGYFHGYFDWVIMFAADDIVQANKMVRNWKSKYAHTIEDIQLQEELMSFRRGGFLNPDYEKELKNIL
jgi:DNA-binding Lrp family transcriptional regulator